MAMIWRTTGPWGTANPGDLTPVQVDNNFWTLSLRITALETTPPVARGVAVGGVHVTLDQLTFTMTDASVEGPFTLPTATWQDVGNWVALSSLGRFKVFHNAGSIYLSLRSHTTAATFDPARTDGPGLEYYSLIMAAPAQPYDPTMFYSLKPPVDGSLLIQVAVARQFWTPTDFAGSIAYLNVAATTKTLVFPLYQNTTHIGDITFVPGVGVDGTGGQTGVFSHVGSSPVQFSAGQRLRLLAPTISPQVPDETAKGLSLTIWGTTGLA
jgi:hypothetical protein